MSIPVDQLSLILELFLNNEMEKRLVIKAIQRLAENAFEAEKSAANFKARNAAQNWLTQRTTCAGLNETKTA